MTNTEITANPKQKNTLMLLLSAVAAAFAVLTQLLPYIDRNTRMSLNSMYLLTGSFVFNMFDIRNILLVFAYFAPYVLLLISVILGNGKKKAPTLFPLTFASVAAYPIGCILLDILSGFGLNLSLSSILTTSINLALSASFILASVTIAKGSENTVTPIVACGFLEFSKFLESISFVSVLGTQLQTRNYVGIVSTTLSVLGGLLFIAALLTFFKHQSTPSPSLEGDGIPSDPAEYR